MNNHSYQMKAQLCAMAVVIAVTGQPSVANAAIEEIVVTTRKREENLQDVPISVTAFTVADMERKGMNNLEDITRQTAGVIFDNGGMSAQDMTVIMRGLNPTRGRQNVAILQDGIDVSSESILTAGGSLLMNTRLFDIERVEVVKGPQMALYGRSAFAGAINYISKRPGDEVEGKVNFDVGDYGQFEAGAGISGPVIENRLSMGVNASSWRHDGYYSNSITNGDLGGEDGYGVSGSALFHATDDLSFWLRAEYSHDDFEPRARAIIERNTMLQVPPSAIPGVTTTTTVPAFVGSYGDADGRFPIISQNPRTGFDYVGSRRNIFRTTLTTEWQNDAYKVTSLTHYADATVYQFEDAQIVGSSATTQTSAGLGFGGEFYFDTKTKLLSQELRLASNGDGPVNWMVGGLYWDERATLYDGSVNVLSSIGSGAAALAPIGTTLSRNLRFNERRTKHWSAFGLVEWAFTDQLALTLEGRYVNEYLEVTGSSANALAIIPSPFFSINYPPSAGLPVTGTDRDSFFTPKATLEWKPADAVMLYASVAKSEKPSGISTLTGGAGGFNVGQNRFDSEKMYTYEIGSKTAWFNDSLQLNGSLFYEDFKDKQASSTVVLPDTGLPGVKPENASSAEVWGLELDATWQATEHLSFAASYAWLDTEYKGFLSNTSSPDAIANAGNCTVVTVGTSTLCQVDLSGNTLEGVPRNALNVSVQYKAPVNNDLDWFVQTEVLYQDDRYDSSSNSRWFDSYTLTDLRFGVQAADGWDVMVYVDNVFDDDTIKTGLTTADLRTFVPPGTIYNAGKAMLPDPRTFGIRGSYRF